MPASRNQGIVRRLAGLSCFLVLLSGCGMKDSSAKTESSGSAAGTTLESHRSSDPGQMTVKFGLNFVELRIRGEGSEFTGLWVDLFQTTVSTDGTNARNGRGTVNHKSWCASFLQWMISAVESSTGKKSPIYPSKIVMEMWEKSTELQVKAGSQEAKNPKPGWIAVWERKRIDNQPVEAFLRGHAELVVGLKSQNPFVIDTIGGNTALDPEGTNPAEGNGVFRHDNNDILRFGRGNTSWKYTFLGFLKTWGN